MKELWADINNWLNCYGGLISTISLFLSIFIYIKTGQIKNNIKNLLNHDNYEKRRNQAKKKLEGLLESIEQDNIFDDKLLGEINREIASLEHFSVFFDRKTKKNINLLKKQLNQNYELIKKEKHNLIIAINKLIGDLEVKETYLG
jgi:hypothetical protein